MTHLFDPESMAAYYADQEMLAELEGFSQLDARPPTRETEWRCRDGARVPIKDMADGHLLNTIRVLQGKSPHGTTFKCDAVLRRALLNVMANEAYRRGLELLKD